MVASTHIRILDPKQASALLDNIVADVREMLNQTIQFEADVLKGKQALSEDHRQYLIYPNVCSDFSRAAAGAGYCGHAQTFIISKLEDLGYSVQSFTIQSLGNKATHNHVALSVEIQTTEGAKRFLIDPTFQQFCTDDPNDPGSILSSLPEGEFIKSSLLDKGYVELTARSAHDYLAAFCKGASPFNSDKKAMNYFSNSSDIRSKCTWPPKEYLIDNGWLASLNNN